MACLRAVKVPAEVFTFGGNGSFPEIEVLCPK